MREAKRGALGLLGAAMVAGGCGGSSRVGQPPCVTTAGCDPGLTCVDGYCISFTPPPNDAGGMPVDARGTDGGGAATDAGSEVDATVGRDAGPTGGGPSGQVGASCNTNTNCGSGLFCAGTGCTTPGTCNVRPEVCVGIYDPVCACDGRTYSNACNANFAGFRVSAAGPCP